jgi:hypothetical protein
VQPTPAKTGYIGERACIIRRSGTETRWSGGYQIARSAAGNPFFAEEMVRDLVDRGVLAGSRGDYRRHGDINQIAVPATVHTVLAARIDRPPPQAKSVPNAASVIGTRFDLGVVQALLPNAEQADLAELVRVELVDQIEFVPRERYCFRHQNRSVRIAPDHRLAAAIEALNPSAADDKAALIATHLEAAADLEAACGRHMRAAGWLQTRDMVAARTSWERARRIADRLPDKQSLTSSPAAWAAAIRAASASAHSRHVYAPRSCSETTIANARASHGSRNTGSSLVGDAGKGGNWVMPPPSRVPTPRSKP